MFCSDLVSHCSSVQVCRVTGTIVWKPVVQQTCHWGWSCQVGDWEQTGVREKCWFTNKGQTDTKCSIPPWILWRNGTDEKRKKKPKKTEPTTFHQNKQAGHPNFSIRAPREGQEMDQFSLAPTIPQPCRADFGGEKEIYVEFCRLTSNG